MGADVVGVAVAAGGVVGDDDVGVDLVDDAAHGGRGVGEARAGPGPRVPRGGRAGHPGVAPPRGRAVGAGSEEVLGHPEGGQRTAELPEPVRGERVALGPLEVGEGGGDDLALLAERAGEDVDLVAARDVVRERHPRGEGLVVGVGVDEQQPGGAVVEVDAVEEPGHGDTAMSANSTTPPPTALADRLRTSEPAT